MKANIIVFSALFLLVAFSQVHAAPNHIQQRIEDIQNLWNEGQVGFALSEIDKALVTTPKEAPLHKLRGDLLMLQRQNTASLESYDHAIRLSPKNVEARWAKWSLLTRMGEAPEAIQELQSLTKLDSTNPVLFFRLANALRRVDRLEESIPAYQQAIALAPEQLRWHLALARTYYDVLKNEEARQVIEHVLNETPPGSSVHTGATRLLGIVEGGTTDKGRRSLPFGATREGALHNRDWALTRGKAWELMNQGEYAEAESVLKKVIAIKPQDHRGYYDLGKTLMELNRWEEATQVLEQSIALSPDGDIYPDAVFRIGQCLAHGAQWDEARKRFDRVLAIEHWRKEPTYSMTFPHLHKVEAAQQEAISQARRLGQLTTEPLLPTRQAFPHQTSVTTQRAPEHHISIQETNILPDRDATIGRDSFRAWFSHIMPAENVERDDLQTGTHDFLPLNPKDTFYSNQEEILLVFGVLSPSYDAIQLTAEYVYEPGTHNSVQTSQGRDTVELSNSEQSGYFVLSAPDHGWPVGIYRVDLFMGDEVSPATHVDEVWFRIIETSSQH